MTAVASKGVGTMSHISMLFELGDALLTTLEFHQGSDNVPTLVSLGYLLTDKLLFTTVDWPSSHCQLDSSRLPIQIRRVFYSTFLLAFHESFQ